MADVNFLLTDEFIQFSKEIAALQAAKKAKEAEFKLVYDQFRKDIQAIEAEATENLRLFEEWKAGQGKAG